MESVYLETSVIGYLAMRPSKNWLVASNQRVTHEWWTNHRMRYDLSISEAVVAECGVGDPGAASERAVYLQGISSYQVTLQVRELADDLLKQAGLPAKADIDAIHIAVAALNGADYLMTWNCKHIANLNFRRKIEMVLMDHGLVSPLICTPQDMMYV